MPTNVLSIILPLLPLLLLLPFPSTASTPAAAPPPPRIDPSPLTLINGSHNATDFTNRGWTSSSCTVANAYQDFFVDVTTEEQLNSNLFIAVIISPLAHANGGLREHLTNAIELKLWEDEIPADRKSDIKKTTSSDNVYSLVVNANEIRKGRYYFSVKCGDLGGGVLPLMFDLLVEFETATLTQDVTDNKALCEGEMMLHYALLTPSNLHTSSSNTTTTRNNTNVNVNFKVCTPPSSPAQLTILTKVGTPPLRIEPPMKIIELGGGCTVFKVCGKQLDVGKVWVGVYARRACSYYNVSYSLSSDVDDDGDGDDESCSLTNGDSLESTAASRTLPTSHSLLASCQPHEWIDFTLHLTNQTRNNNLVVEAKTISGYYNPDAISLHLFIGEIPNDRETEYRASTSSSSVFSVFKSSVSMNKLLLEHVTVVNVGVRCGATEQRFRIIAEDVKAELMDGKVTRGEVCPGSWIHHFIDAPLLLPGESESDESFDQIEIIFKYYVYGTGSITSTIQMTDFPIRIGPPWVTASGSVNSGIEEVRVCNAERGKRYFAGVVTDTECMVYDVELNVKRNNSCVQPLQAGFTNEVHVEKITVNMPLPDTCDEGEYKLYSFNIDIGSEENFVIQVETRKTASDDSDDPHALELLIFKDGFPRDGYESEYKTTEGVAWTWSFALDSHDIEPGIIHIAVKGKTQHVRYHLVVIAIKAALVIGERSRGEICENEFVYHTFRLPPSLPTGNSSVAASSIRTHLNVHIWSYSGEFSVMARHNFYPLKLDPPSSQLTRSSMEANIKLCNVSTTSLQVITLVGGHGCAGYDAMSSIFHGDDCEELETFADVDERMGKEEIQVDHVNLGSCRERRHVDYFLDVKEGETNKNLVFTVENLGGSKSFASDLRLCIYSSKIPINRLSERCVSQALHGVLSYPLDSSEVTPGLWFFSISCVTESNVRFRFVSHSLEADLQVGRANHAEVCRGNALLQKHLVTSEAMQKVKVGVEVNALGSSSSSAAVGVGVGVKSGVHLRLNIAKYVGELFAIARHDEAPVKLISPFMFFSGTDRHLSLDLCNVEVGTVGWFAFLGGDVCSVFDSTLYYHTGECKEMADHAVSSAIGSATQLWMGLPQLNSCKINEWKDFYVTVTEDMIGSNLLFEVVLRDNSDLKAISFQIYEFDFIPENRETPYVTSMANPNGVYSFSVSSARTERGVVGMNVLMSVKCGPRPVQFSLIGVQSTSLLLPNTANRGEVCNNEWVYFHYDIPSDLSHTHANGFVRFNVEKFVGAIFLKGQANDMPLRLVYPFVNMKSDVGFISIDVCEVKAGERIWLAIRGSNTCATFDVITNFYINNQDTALKDFRGEHLVCDAEASATRAVASNFVPLRLNEEHFDSCKKGSFSKLHFKLHLEREDLGSNLAIVVEQLLEDRVDPRALSVFGFPSGQVPVLDIEGNAVTKSEEAIENVHSVTLNFVDLMAGGGLADIAFAIKCGPNADVNFKILTELVKTSLTAGKLQNGGVCPEAWIYHNFITSNQTPPSPSTAKGGGGDISKFLRFKFRLIAGSVYQVAVREDYPPSFNSFNVMAKQIESAVAVMTFVEFDIDVCDVKGGENYFFGVFGSQMGCALYDIAAREYEEGEVGEDGDVKSCKGS